MFAQLVMWSPGGSFANYGHWNHRQLEPLGGASCALSPVLPVVVNQFSLDACGK